MKNIILIIMTILLQFFCNVDLCAQETEESIGQAQTYLEHRSSSLEKYLKRTDKIQQRLLKRLKRKEDKILRKLAAKDSALYNQYTAGRNISFDSIATLSRDSAYQKKQGLTSNKLVDSLKGVQNFIQKQSSKLSSVTGKAEQLGVQTPYSKELGELQQKLGTQASIDALIGQRSNALESLARQANISGLQGIQKQVYYAKAKMKAWKELTDEPDDIEAEALEYLQGTEGFAESLKASNTDQAYGGLGNNATAEDLQRMGFQTKSSVNKMLTEKLGNNLGAVQEQMAGQVKEYSDKLGDVSGKISEAKEGISDARQTLAEAKQASNNLKNINETTFKKNPEREKPFWRRLELLFNFQASKATNDGLRPAMLEFGAGVAFKHTPKLSYGIGISLSTGLGRNWQNIKLSYEGISARAYADWKMIYGFSVQAGYERIFRPANRNYLPLNINPDNKNNDPDPNQTDNIFKEAFGGQQQAAYIGIMKRYRINRKWNGTFLAGYNFLWQQEGLRSPWMLRFGWGG